MRTTFAGRKLGRMHVFLVRVWEPAGPMQGHEQPLLRGVVEQVGTREQAVFVGGEYLVAFLTRLCEQPPQVRPEGA